MQYSFRRSQSKKTLHTYSSKMAYFTDIVVYVPEFGIACHRKFPCQSRDDVLPDEVSGSRSHHYGITHITRKTIYQRNLFGMSTNQSDFWFLYFWPACNVRAHNTRFTESSRNIKFTLLTVQFQRQNPVNAQASTNFVDTKETIPLIFHMGFNTFWWYSTCNEIYTDYSLHRSIGWYIMLSRLKTHWHVAGL